jgi:hypothetical protein
MLSLRQQDHRRWSKSSLRSTGEEHHTSETPLPTCGVSYFRVCSLILRSSLDNELTNQGGLYLSRVLEMNTTLVLLDLKGARKEGKNCPRSFLIFSLQRATLSTIRCARASSLVLRQIARHKQHGRTM